jgi:hypothetical protein
VVKRSGYQDFYWFADGPAYARNLTNPHVIEFEICLLNTGDMHYSQFSYVILEGRNNPDSGDEEVIPDRPKPKPSAARVRRMSPAAWIGIGIGVVDGAALAVGISLTLRNRIRAGTQNAEK